MGPGRPPSRPPPLPGSPGRDYRSKGPQRRHARPNASEIPCTQIHRPAPGFATLLLQAVAPGMLAGAEFPPGRATDCGPFVVVGRPRTPPPSHGRGRAAPPPAAPGAPATLFIITGRPAHVSADVDHP